jgi:ABC-2 type transport system ATP-binding protein
VTRARSAITATGLRKSFGDQVVVLDGVDLDVAEGTIFALRPVRTPSKIVRQRLRETRAILD